MRTGRRKRTREKMHPFKGLYWKKKRLRLRLSALLSSRHRFSVTGRAGLRKLNLGAGERPLPGWVNCDLEEHPGIDVAGDVRNLGGIGDASFDVVRASHVLEHFYLNEVPSVVREWNRVLKPGGFLLVCVPDFRGIAVDYLDNPGILQPGGLALPIDQRTPPDKYVYLAHIYGWGYEDERRPAMKHHIVFDFRSLSGLLRRQGLIEVREYDYRREEPYLLGIEDASTNLWSLNVAAVKPMPRAAGPSTSAGREGH
jgi:predicted SAM-dependent methyltransferase